MFLAFLLSLPAFAAELPPPDERIHHVQHLHEGWDAIVPCGGDEHVLKNLRHHLELEFRGELQQLCDGRYELRGALEFESVCLNTKLPRFFRVVTGRYACVR